METTGVDVWPRKVLGRIALNPPGHSRHLLDHECNVAVTLTPARGLPLEVGCQLVQGGSQAGVLLLALQVTAVPGERKWTRIGGVVRSITG